MTTLIVNTLVAIACALSVATGAAVQDPLSAVPDAYRLVFENAWVKVVRVHYGPNVVISPHFHTERASAYVYLNEGGPILFKHEGLPYAGVTRPATKAGSFRVYKGLKEVHSVENPTDTPSEFLRVEFKTDPVDEASLRGKFFREEPTPASTIQRTQFENGQVRITRLVVAPGDALDIAAAADQPTLLVALTSAEVTDRSAIGEDDARRLDIGHTAWVGGGDSTRLRGPDTTPSEVLRFEFKT